MDDLSTELRMVLIVRQDLLMGIGKAMGQAGHAFTMTLLLAQERIPEVVEDYLTDAQPKIVVGCKNLAALLRAQDECRDAGLVCVLVRDAGRTVFPEPTDTCMGIGPCRRIDLPKFVQRMRLL